MVINITRDHNWSKKERDRPLNSCHRCKVDEIKHITGGCTTLISDYTKGHTNALSSALPAVLIG